eukprot:RCo034971
MLQELRAVPSLFAAVADPKNAEETVKLSVGLDDEAKKLCISAVDVTNASFSGCFDEAELGKIKARDVEWKDFFKEIETAFNTKTVTVVADPAAKGLTVTYTGAGAPVKFPLTRATEGNGSLKMLERLAQFYNLRHEKNAAEKALEELTKKDGELHRKVLTLEQDKVSLKETIAHAEAEERVMMDKYAELQGELAQLMEKHKQACEKTGADPTAEDESAPLDPDFSQCIARIPLGQNLQRDYDPSLLKLIKSKFIPAETEEDATREIDPVKDKHMKVIRPFTTNEFEAQMKLLPESPKYCVMKVMEKIDKWNYDVWTVSDFTNKGALFTTAYAIFMRWDFLRKFGVDEAVVINFLSQVEGGYHPNPYHNSMHGADVLHIVHYILSSGELKERCHLTDEDTFAAIIAGMIHDYDHPGLNNNFHIKVQSYLATLYNDRSILENHHCAEVFELMKNPNFNILAGLTEVQRRDVRETIIDMVLSTDMGLHAKIFGNWKRRIGQDHDLHKRKDDQRLALAMAIKMADISNCGRPENLYLKWGTKLSEEFFLQGANER